MIKKVISPFQKVLLDRRLCVGCTHPLEKATKLADLTDTRELFQCKCKRRYVKDNELNIYRRATFEEESSFLRSKNAVK